MRIWPGRTYSSEERGESVRDIVYAKCHHHDHHDHSLVNFLAPRRFPAESRPFLDEPPPRLVAVRIWVLRPNPRPSVHITKVGQDSSDNTADMTARATGVRRTGRTAEKLAADVGRERGRCERLGAREELAAEHAGGVDVVWVCRNPQFQNKAARPSRQRTDEDGSKCI